MSKLYRFTDDEMPHEFANVCTSKEITSASVIRMEKIKNLEPAFGNDPSFYGIYIFRDPRGVFLDRNNQWDVDDSEIEAFCKMYKENLDYLQLQNDMGRKILPLRYEEIELYPEIFMQKVYDFIQKPDNPGAQTVFEGFRTYFESAFEGNTRFTNTADSIFGWWVESSPDHWQRVQKYCDQSLLEALGYTWVTDQEMMYSLKAVTYDSDAGMNDDSLWPMKKSWSFGN